MYKIETTSKVSQKLTRKINLGRQGARAELSTLDTAHRPPHSPERPSQANKDPQPPGTTPPAGQTPEDEARAPSPRPKKMIHQAPIPARNTPHQPKNESQPLRPYKGITKRQPQYPREKISKPQQRINLKKHLPDVGLSRDPYLVRQLKIILSIVENNLNSDSHLSPQIALFASMKAF